MTLTYNANWKYDMRLTQFRQVFVYILLLHVKLLGRCIWNNSTSNYFLFSILIFPSSILSIRDKDAKMLTCLAEVALFNHFRYKAKFKKYYEYRISANCFRGNYSVFFGLMYCDLCWHYIKVRKLFKGGNYSRRKLFADYGM